MQKSFLLFIFMLIICCLAFGQTKGILKYKIVMNDKKVSITTQERITYFNSKLSIEFAGKSFISDINKNDETKGSVTIANKKPFFVYKDFSNKTLKLSGKVGNRDYLINDTLSNFKWKITKERKKILNYNCIKATTEFRGRAYEAWYTEEIPIPNGPWKLCGLPGLIVKAYDDKLAFVFDLKEINLKTKFDEKIISIPKEYIRDKPISHQEFMVLYNKKLSDYAKLSKVVHTSKNGGYGTVSIIVGELMEKY